MKEMFSHNHLDKPGQGETRSGHTNGNQRTVSQSANWRHLSSAQTAGGLGYLHKLPATRTHSDDLVVEDSVEDGETLLGGGKSGLFVKASVPRAEPATYPHSATSPPRSSRHGKGLAKPIISSMDEMEKRQLQRYKKPTGRRNLDQNTDEAVWRSKHQQLDSTVESGSCRTRASSGRTASDVPGPRVPGPRTQSEKECMKTSQAFGTQINRQKEEIDNILSMTGKRTKQQQKNLTVKTSRHASAASRKEATDELDDYEYDITKSSIFCDKVTSRPGSGTSSASKTSSRSWSSPDALNSRSASSTSSNGHSVIKSGSGSSLKVSDFEDIGDLEELGALHLGCSFAKQPMGAQVDSKPIDLKTAVALKTLVLGNAKQCFTEEWKYQSFTFNDAMRLRYGFVQKKGGPCGVLASVQAFLLQQLLFADGCCPSTSRLNPNDSERMEALAIALATIFWRAGHEQMAVVTLPSFRPQFVGGAHYKSDNLTETLFVNTFTNYENMLTFIKQNITQFECDGTSGIILALYSVILSRSVEGVRSDMDETDGKLIGAHGYCTQDMVNLFLAGRAASNVFNDVVELDSGQGQITLLKGIHARSDVGFLSLFEHYKSCEVGTYYKTPRYPIWVVCSESHFTVLFGLKRELLSNWKAERRFDLFYYDGLARQEDEIRLSIDTRNRFYQAPSDDDLVPPLELCIRTKWADAEINWNGTEPLL